MSKEWVEIEDTINYITEHLEIRNCSAEWIVNKLNEQADRIAELGKEIAIRNQKLNELKTEIHKRDESLQRKKQQVEDVHKAVHQAKKESAKKGRQVCKANNEVVQYRKQVLKLEEQLKNAIVLPQDLQIGNKVYFIDVEEKYIHTGKIYSITKELNYEENGFITWIYCRYNDGLTFTHPIRDYGVELFSTKEEAEAKLKEMKSE